MLREYFWFQSNGLEFSKCRAAPEGPYRRVSAQCAHHPAEPGYHTTDPSLWGSLRHSFAVVVLAYYCTCVRRPLLAGRPLQVLRLEPVRLQQRLRRLAHPVRLHASGLHLPPGRLVPWQRCPQDPLAQRGFPPRRRPLHRRFTVLCHVGVRPASRAPRAPCRANAGPHHRMHVAAALLALAFLFRCQAGATTGSGSSSGAPWASRPAAELG